MATETARRITYVPLEAIRPAVRNAKQHDVATLCESIARFGFTNALIVDDRTERLVGGHGRWEALVVLRAGGSPTPDGILVDEDGGWLVPVQRGWASKDDAEAEAYVLLDNRLVELGGGYDDRLLSAMLEDLNANTPDLFELLHYSEEDMEALLRYSRDASDEGPGSPALLADEDDELGTDHGMTDVPDAPTREKVRCPECGWHFVPGDRAA